MNDYDCDYDDYDCDYDDYDCDYDDLVEYDHLISLFEDKENKEKK